MKKEFKLDERTIKLGVDLGSSEEVLRYGSRNMNKIGYVKDTYENCICEREKKYPTGLPIEGVGVAIPHTDTINVIKPMISIITLKNPVKFKRMDDPKECSYVKILFMLAMTDPNCQVNLLSNLMGIIQDNELLNNILNSKEPKQVINYLQGRLNF